MDLATLLMEITAERNAEWHKQVSDFAGVIKEQIDQVKALNDILSRINEESILSDAELDTLVAMGIITQSERSDCNDPGRRDVIAQRIERKLSNLNAAIQMNMQKLQDIVADDTTALIISGIDDRTSIVANLRSEPKFACEDENGNLLFINVEYGEHTFALFDEKGGWIAGIKLRLENDASRPASTQWTLDADGVWVFNVGGNSALTLADISLNDGTDGTKSIEFTGGAAVNLPEPRPIIWPYVAGGTVILLGAAAAFLLLYRKHRRDGPPAVARQ